MAQIDSKRAIQVGAWTFTCSSFVLALGIFIVMFKGHAFAQESLNRSAFAQPPPLPEPDGAIVRATNAASILSLGEALSNDSTLMIEPGNYTLPRPFVLRGKSNITIRSASGQPASVTITGRGWDLGDEHDDLLHITDCTNVLVAGLTFAECRSYGIKVEAERNPRNVNVLNCRFRNIGIRAIKGSASPTDDSRALRGSVRFCDFENDRVPPEHWLFNGDYIAAIDMMALDDWTFSDNSFRNIRGRHGGGRAAIFIWVRSRRIIVERNHIVNCDRGISFGNPGQSTANRKDGSPLRYVTDGIIQNNWISGGADCGIELWHAEGIQIRHNSIWRPDSNWNRGIRVGQGVTQTEIVNNLVHGGIQLEGSEANVHDNLSRRLEDTFVDAAHGNLSLRPTVSKAATTGKYLPTSPNDLRGYRRERSPSLGAWELGATNPNWVASMKAVHARFKGAPGTFAQLGDSITYSGAFWSALAATPKHMTSPVAEEYRRVRGRLKPEAWRQKGPDFGNQGSMTMQWARDNVSRWLATMNPEVAVILFGSNDAAHDVSVDEFIRTTRQVISACLSNGTIVLLTTTPPQATRETRCREYASALRFLATELQVPLIDFDYEILSRRPFDWNGAGPEFAGLTTNPYEVPTLISGDGVHPSNPQAYQNDFSTEALRTCGYGLRNYLTMRAYAEVIRDVLD